MKKVVVALLGFVSLLVPAYAEKVVLNRTILSPIPAASGNLPTSGSGSGSYVSYAADTSNWKIEILTDDAGSLVREAANWSTTNRPNASATETNRLRVNYTTSLKIRITPTVESTFRHLGIYSGSYVGGAPVIHSLRILVPGANGSTTALYDWTLNSTTVQTLDLSTLVPNGNFYLSLQYSNNVLPYASSYPTRWFAKSFDVFVSRNSVQEVQLSPFIFVNGKIQVHAYTPAWVNFSGNPYIQSWGAGIISNGVDVQGSSPNFIGGATRSVLEQTYHGGVNYYFRVTSAFGINYRKEYNFQIDGAGWLSDFNGYRSSRPNWKIIAYSGSTLFLDGAGKIWGTGSNASGLLGLGSTTSVNRPTQVAGGPFVDLGGSVGNGNPMGYALSASGDLYRWGVPNTLPITTPQAIPNAPIGVDAITGASKSTGLFVRANNQVQSIAADSNTWVSRSWANNSFAFGQEKWATYFLRETGALMTYVSGDPDAVLFDIDNVVHISQNPATSYIVAIKSDRTAWVLNHSNKANPAQIRGPNSVPFSGAVMGVAGSYLLLKNDGTVWSFTYNPSTNTTTNAVQVAGLSNIQYIAGSGSTNFAVTFGGTVYAWGANESGQLGLGTNTASVTNPTVITGFSMLGGMDSTPPLISFTPSLPLPSGEWYTADQTLTVQVSDANSGVNTGSVQYRVNGAATWTSLPWGQSIPMATQGTHTIEVKALDNAGNPGSASFVYRLDQTNPTINVTSDPLPGTWTNGSVTLSVTASDAQSGVKAGTLQHSSDGSTWTNYTAALTVTAPGQTRYFRVTDNAGRIGTAQWTVNNMDTTAPATPTVTSSPAKPTWGQSVTLSATSADAASGLNTGTWRWGRSNGSGGWTDWITGSSRTFTTSGLVAVEVKDNAGNVSLAQWNIDNVDTTPPVLTVTPSQAVPASGWYTADLTLTVNVSDSQSGLNGAQTTFTLNGGTAQAFLNGRVLNIGTNGTHAFVFSATDNAGRTTTVSTTVKLDKTAPTFSLKDGTTTLGASAYYINSLRNLSVAVADSGSGLNAAATRYRVNAGTWAALTNGQTLTVSTPGTYVYEFEVKDLAGNLTSATRTVVLDTLAPTLTLTPSAAVPASGWYTAAPTLAVGMDGTGSSLNSSLTKYSLNGQTAVSLTSGNPASHTATLTLDTLGTNTLAFTIVDLAGNTTTQNYSYKFDNGLPVVSLTPSTSVPASGWYTSDQTLTASLTDAVSGLAASGHQYRLNGGAWQTLAHGQQITLSANGTNTYELKALDAAGNTRTQSFTFKLDKNKPTLTATPSVTPNAQGWIKTAGTLNLVTADTGGSGLAAGALQTYRLNGGAWASLPASLALNLPGVHTYDFEIRDIAGNITTQSYTYRLDTTLPTLTLTPSASPSATGWYQGSHTLNIRVSDAVSGLLASATRYKVGSGAWTALTDNLTLTLNTPGITILTFEVSDLADNLVTDTYTYRLDTANPTMTLTPASAPNAAGWYSANSALNLTYGDASPGSGLDTGRNRYRVNGGSWIPLPTSGQSLARDQEGSHTLDFEVYDISGRSVTASHTYKLDKTPPVITVAQSPSGWTAGSKTVSATFTDAHSGINTATRQFSIDGGQTWVSGTSVVLNTNGTVRFRVSDLAGHQTTVDYSVTGIDLAPPTATLNAPAFTAGPWTVSWLAEDTGSGLVSPLRWWWADAPVSVSTVTFDAGTEATAQKTGSFVVPTAARSEGEQTLIVEFRDSTGQTTQVSATVLVDRSAPAVLSWTLTDATFGVWEDWTVPYPGTQAALTWAVQDQLGAGTRFGDLALAYLVSPVNLEGAALTDAPGWQSLTGKGDTRQATATLNPGLNHLYLRATDEAGNTAYSSRTLRQYGQRPGTTLVSSSTHARYSLPRHSSALTDAQFTLQGLSGEELAGFEVELLKGGNPIPLNLEPVSDVPSLWAPGPSFIAAENGQAAFTAWHLTDNELDETYKLVVRSRGVNRLVSSVAAEYVFHVDTTPPALLTVFSSSHPFEDRWYAGETGGARITWNEPADLSGIQGYFYRADAPESSPVDPGRVSPAALLSQGWTAISTRGPVFIPYQGPFVVSVIAMDYAGNTQFAQRNFLADSVKPVIGAGELTISLSSEDAVAGTIDLTVTGPNVEDVIPAESAQAPRAASASPNPALVRHSGLVDGLIKIILTGTRVDIGQEPQFVTTEWTQLVPPSELVPQGEPVSPGALVSGLVFSELPSTGTTYSVRLEALDGAGNFSRRFGTNAYRTTDSPEQVPVTITELWEGQTLSYTQLDSNYMNPTWGLASVLDLDAETLDLSADESTFVVDESDGQLLGAQLETLPGPAFSFSQAGFNVSGYLKGLTRVGDLRGLTLENLSWQLPANVLTNGQTTVTATSGHYVLPGSRRLVAQADWNLGERIYPHLSAGSSARWQLAAPLTHQLDEEGWTLKNGLWNTQAWPTETAGLSFTRMDGLNQTSDLPFAEAVISSDGVLTRLVPAGLSQNAPWQLTLGGSTYEVSDFTLTPEGLAVGYAVLNLPAGYSPQSLVLVDFIVTPNGTIQAADGFAVLDAQGQILESLTVTVPEGGSVVLDLTEGSLSWVGDTLVVNGVYNDGSANYSLGNLSLGSEGYGFDLGATGGAQTLTIHGFKVTAPLSTLESLSVLVLPQAEIEMPSALGGALVSITGLKYNRLTGAVVEPGLGSAAFTIPLDRSPYGAELTASGLRLDDSGVWALGLNLPLPSPWVGPLTLAQVSIASSGALAWSAQPTETTPLGYGAFSLQMQGLSFDGSLLSWTGFTVPVASAAGGTLAFSNGNLNAAGFNLEPVSAAAAGYLGGDWTFQLGVNFRLNGAGHLVGPARITLSEALGGEDLIFNQFALTGPAAGQYATGSAAQSVWALVSGWMLELRQPLLNGNLIESTAAALVLPSLMGGETALFEGLKVAQDATLAAPGTLKAPFNLRSLNGYQVAVSSVSFEAGGLALGGVVALPPGLQPQAGANTLSYAAGELFLNDLGQLVSRSAKSNIGYRFAGFDLQAATVNLELAGFRFLGNTTSVELKVGDLQHTQALPLGDLSFYPDGGLSFQNQAAAYEPFTLFGAQFQLLGLKMTEEGLEARSVIRLPASLNNTEVYFDPLLIRSDGRILSTAAVPVLSFPVSETQFEFRNLRFGYEGFEVGEALITLPASLESKQIRLYNVGLSAEGDFVIGSASMDPFDLFGYGVYLDDLAYKDAKFTIAGRLRLPQNAPGDLAGRVLHLDKLEMGINGTLYELKASDKNGFRFEFQEGFVFSGTEIALNVAPSNGTYLFKIGLAQARLSFPTNLLPEGVVLGDAVVNDFVLTLNTGAVDFSSAQLEPSEFTAWGAHFALNELTLTKELVTTFRGALTLPEDESLPAVLRGRQLTLHSLAFRPGSLDSIDASTTLSNENFFDALVLNSGKVRVKLLAGNLTLGLEDASLTFGSGFGSALGGRQLSDIQFAYDFSAGRVTAFAAKALSQSFTLEGLAVEGADFSLLLNGYQASGLPLMELAVANAKIRLPAAAPGLFKNGLLNVGQFKMNTAGQMLALDASFALPTTPTALLGDVLVSNGLLRAVMTSAPGASVPVFQFQASNVSLALGSGFEPLGLAGLSGTLSQLTFDTAGTLGALSGSVNLPAGRKLLQSLEVTGGSLGLGLSQGVTVITASNLGLKLNHAALPQGLNNLSLTVSEFALTTTGKLQALNLTALPPTGSFLGFLDIPATLPSADRPRLSLTRTGDSSFVIGASGKVQLPSTFPGGLAGLPLTISQFAITNSGVIQQLSISTDLSNRKILDFLQVDSGTLSVRKDPAATGTVFITELTNAVVKLPTQGFPDGLAGLPITLSSLVIDSNGTVRNVNVGADLSGRTLLGFLEVRQGQLTLESAPNNTYVFGLNGTFALPSQGFPAELAGRTVTGVFKMGTDGVVKTLDLSTTLSNTTLFGALELGPSPMQPVTLRVQSSNGSAPLISVSGQVRTPVNFPEGLQQRVMTIHDFRVSTSGGIQAVDISAELSKIHVLGFLEVDPAGTAPLVLRFSQTSPGVYQFALSGKQPGQAGQVSLPASFPEGLAGQALNIKSFAMNTQGVLTALDLEVPLDNKVILGNLRFGPAGGSILNRVVVQKTGALIETSVQGRILLPETLPQGLAGMSLDIANFKIASNGTITALNIGASNINIDNLFGTSGLHFRNGSFSTSVGTGNEVRFTGGGKLKLPGTLPGGLAGAEVDSSMTFSTTRGVTAFSASLSSVLNIPVFTGVTARITSLSVTQADFGLSGELLFDSSFPVALPSIALTSFRMNWQGQVLELGGGIASYSTTISGFQASVKNLVFSKTGLAIGEAVLALPAPLDKHPLILRNAGVTAAGQFYGTASTSSISTNLAGMELYFNNPSLNVSQARLSFSKVGLKAPAALGGFDIALNGVAVTGNGVTFGGGAFRIPDFTVGAVGFKDIRADILFDNGQYRIEAAAKGFVQGLGELSADMAFRNVDQTYPLGLEYAFLEYTLSAPGLPIGTTNLFLTKIRGGLAFGPPREVPQAVRYNFTGRARISLGVTIGDRTGKLVRGDVDFWIDIDKPAIALQGQVTLLSGLASGRVLATLGPLGFMGQVYVNVTFAEGTVTVYVFPYQGSTQVSGSGNVRFRLLKGSIIDQRIGFDTWWGYVELGRIQIPWETIQLMSGGADFGRFTNSRTGILGWLDVPFFGKISAFVPQSGGIQFPNASEYTLLTPENMNRSRTGSAAQRSLGLDRLEGRGSLPAADPRASGLERPAAQYRFNSQEILTRQVNHPLNPANQARARQGSVSGGRSGSLGAASSNPAPEAAQVERILFALAFQTGQPALIAVDAQGREYRPGDEGTSVVYTDWGLLFAVEKPAPGEWGVRVEGMSEADLYQVVVMGVSSAPRFEVESLSQNRTPVAGTFLLKGRAWGAAGSPVRVLAASERESYSGLPAGEGVVGSDGRFEVAVDTAQWLDGEYHLIVSVEGSEGTPLKDYAPGSLWIDNRDRALTGPRNLQAYRSGEGEIRFAFENTDGPRPEGFRMKALFAADGTEELWELGYMTQSTWSGLPEAGELRLQVQSFDAAGASPWSEEVTVDLAPASLPPSRFRWGPAGPEAQLPIGESLEIPLSLELEEGEAGTPVRLLVEGPFGEAGPDYPLTLRGVALSLSASELSLGASAPVTLSLTTDASASAGTYTWRLVAQDARDPQRRSTVDVSVALAYKAIRLTGAQPSHLPLNEAVLVSLYGENFSSGTRLTVDGLDVFPQVVSGALMQVEVTAAPGQRQVRFELIGADGTRQEWIVPVLVPYYELRGLLTQTQVQAGHTARFHYEILNRQGFTGGASFSLSGLPSGWTGEAAPVSAEKLPAQASVQVPAETPPGLYEMELVSDQGDRLALSVEVTAGLPAIQVTNLSAREGLPGDLLSLFGSGFGPSPGSLTLEGLTLPVEAWSGERIRVHLPEAVRSGQLRLTRADGAAKTLGFFPIRAFSLDLVNLPAALALSPDESRVLGFRVVGFARDTALSVSAPGLDVSLSRSSVVPNASVELTLKAPADLAPGRYPVTVMAEGSTVAALKTVQVEIGGGFGILTSRLPLARLGVPYNVKLEPLNADGEVTWTLIGGEWPLGLRMNSRGLVSGTPQEDGLADLTLEATDSRGRKAQRRFSLRVQLNLWAQEGMDAGRTFANPIEAPAQDLSAWNRSLNGTYSQLLTGRRRVYAYGEAGLMALDQDTGRPVFRIDSPVEQALWVEGALVLRLKDGTVSAVDEGFGGLLWTGREGVTDLRALQGGLYLASLEPEWVRPEDGQFLGRPAFTLGVGNLSAEGPLGLFRVAGARLEHWTGSAWSTLFEGIRPLTGLAQDAQGLVAWDAAQVYTWNGEVWREGALEGTFSTLALEGGSLFFGGSQGIELDRQTLNLVRTFPGAQGQALAAARKVVWVGAGRVSVYNRHEGRLLWTVAGERAVLAAGAVYVLSAQGDLTAFAGPDNAAPPVTALVANPAAPDGLDGWYKTQPRLGFAAQDAEGPVQATRWRWNDQPWQAFAEAVAPIEDGVQTLWWYSVDADGWEELARSATLRLDTTAPTARLKVEGTPGLNGWILDRAVLTIDAEDTLSGVGRLSLSWNNSEPFVGTEPVGLGAGVYALRWTAADQAGNEAAGEQTLQVDGALPTIHGRFMEQSQRTLFVLDAADDLSGIAQKQYKLNDGPWQAYTQPVLMTRPGRHVIRFKAQDGAGRWSEEGRVDTVVRPVTPRRWVRELRWARWADGREWVEEPGAGTPFYGPRKGNDRNLMPALPAVLEGSMYLRPSRDEAGPGESAYLSFTAEVDLEVYVARDSQANLRLSDDFVETSLLFSGRRLYRKTAPAGSLVVINYPHRFRSVAFDWIFVKPSRLWDLAILQPAEGRVLRGATERVAGLEPEGGASNPRWQVEWKNGPTLDLGTGWEVTLAVPESRRTWRGTLSLSAEIEGRTYTRTQELVITDPAWETLRQRPRAADFLVRGNAPAPESRRHVQGGEELPAHFGLPQRLPALPELLQGADLLVPPGPGAFPGRRDLLEFTAQVDQWIYVARHAEGRKRGPRGFEDAGFSLDGRRVYRRYVPAGLRVVIDDPSVLGLTPPDWIFQVADPEALDRSGKRPLFLESEKL